MSFTIVQIIGEDVNIKPDFIDIDNAVNHINNMTHINVNNSKNTVHSIISINSKIDMDGYYIQKTVEYELFNIIERKTEIIPGWLTNGICQTCKKIGFMKIVNNESLLKRSISYTDCSTQFNKINNKQPVKKKTNFDKKPIKSWGFSAELTNEFMEKIKNLKVNHLK
jgi:hypothetical protein